MNKVIQENRSNNIGTLHLIAALFVMYGHHCAVLMQPTTLLFNCRIQSIGVKTIFIISGYLITKSLWNIRQNRIKTGIIYLIKRLGRLYPEYLVCILFTVFVIGPIFTEIDPQLYWHDTGSMRLYIVSNLLLCPIYWLPGVFASNRYVYTINGSFWTMPVEVALYLLILAVFLFSKKEMVKKVVYAIVTVLVTLLCIIRLGVYPYESIVWHGTDWLQALDVAPYFLIGGLAWLYNWKRYVNLQVSVVGLFLFACGTTMNTLIVDEIICIVVLTYFVLSMMLESEQKVNLKHIKSEYAYGMYLYGFVIQQCVAKVMLSDVNITFANFHVSFIISVILTYCLAAISFECIYLPSNIVIKKILNKLCN